MQKQKSWLTSVAVLGILVGVVSGLYSFSDARVVQEHLTDPQDEILGPLTYLVVGSWMGTLVFFLLGSLIGARLEEDFKGWRVLDRKENWCTLCAGVTGAVATLFYLVGFTKTDPAQVLISSSLTLLILLLIDLGRKHANRGMLGPAFLVLAGITLANLKSDGDWLDWEWKISWEVILITIVARNLFLTTSKLFVKAGTNEKRFPKLDAINFSFWRILFFAVAATLTFIVWSAVGGKFGAFWDLMKTGFLGALPLILITMVLTPFEFVWGFQAQRYGGSASLVNFLGKSEIIIGVLGAYLINWGWEGWLGDQVPTDPLSVILRITGVAAILIGLYPLTRRNVEIEKKEKETDQTLVKI